MPDRSMSRQRLQRYYIFRFLVALGILGWTSSLVLTEENPFSAQITVIRVCAVALVFLVATTLATRRWSPPPWFVYGQLALDLGLASALSALSDGLESFFILLYAATIVSGAYVLALRGALWTAAMASTALVGMLILTGQTVNEGNIMLLYTGVMFRIVAFFLVAALSGQLAESLVRTGAALREERETSETLLERLRAGVVTTDADGKVVSLNPAARLMLEGQAVNRLTDIFQGSAHSPTWEEVRPDGQRWVCSRGALPRGGQVVVMEDVTELTDMRERAARDERLVAVGRLAASVAHEIRNPLASLSGSLQLIGEEHASSMVTLALDEAARLNRLVEDFLDASRAPVLRRRQVSVLEVAQTVAEAFARDGRYGATVKVSVQGQSGVAEVDPDRIRQTLWNLLLNAAQAMPRGGTVAINLAEDGDGLRIAVQDDGPGIPPEDLHRVFDPFYSRRAGGTGLGLALVEQVVRGHGGSVEAHSGEGAGTTFDIWLPRGGSRVA